jgi:hypothetical protein
MLACDRIRILAAFSSGKVMAKLKNCRVFLTGVLRESTILVSSTEIDQINRALPAQWRESSDHMRVAR